MYLKNLWVMRHGLAVNKFDSDFDRQLSESGERQVRDVALQIKAAEGPQPETMLVSPFCRTQMTAEIVHAALEIEQPFVTEDLLVHFADHRLLGDFLMASTYQNLIIVSHMPIVARLCRYITIDINNVHGFETAQATKITFEQPLDEAVYSTTKSGKIEKHYLPQC